MTPQYLAPKFITCSKSPQLENSSTLTIMIGSLLITWFKHSLLEFSKKCYFLPGYQTQKIMLALHLIVVTWAAIQKQPENKTKYRGHPDQEKRIRESNSTLWPLDPTKTKDNSILWNYQVCKLIFCLNYFLLDFCCSQPIKHSFTKLYK